MIKVLLVTNDCVLERMLMVTLTINGLSVTSVSHLSDATSKLSNDFYNVLLLDKEYDDVCLSLRERGLNIPILVFNEPPKEGKVKDVEYLAKPFEFPELKTRMNKLFRTHLSLTEKLIEIGHLKIDVTKQLVMIRDKAVALGKMEFAILVSLARKTGKIVSKEKMRMDLEAQGHFFNTTIYHHIKELKRKIRDVSDESLQIKSVTGEGYQLLAD